MYQVLVITQGIEDPGNIPEDSPFVKFKDEIRDSLIRGLKCDPAEMQVKLIVTGPFDENAKIIIQGDCFDDETWPEVFHELGELFANNTVLNGGQEVSIRKLPFGEILTATISKRDNKRGSQS